MTSESNESEMSQTKLIREQIKKQRDYTFAYYFQHHKELYTEEVYELYDWLCKEWISEVWDPEIMDSLVIAYKEKLSYRSNPKRINRMIAMGDQSVCHESNKNKRFEEKIIINKDKVISILNSRIQRGADDSIDGHILRDVDSINIDEDINNLNINDLSNLKKEFKIVNDDLNEKLIASGEMNKTLDSQTKDMQINARHLEQIKNEMS